MAEMIRSPKAAPGLFLRTVLLALLAHAAPSPVSAQVDEPTPIATVIADLDGDFVPDDLGATVAVWGTVTSPPRRTRSDLRYVRIQDRMAAVRVVAERGSMLDSLQVGDVVWARGELRQYRGADELHVAELRRFGTSPVPEPRDVLAIDLLSGRYASQLVRLSGELTSRVVRDGRDTNRDFEFRDRSGRIEVRVPSSWLDEDGVENLLRGGDVVIVAIAEQSQEVPPFNAGYRLEPRELADIHFVPQPPVLALSVALAFCLLAGSVFYSVWRRKDAERRTAELERLYQDLSKADEALRASEAALRNAQEIAQVGSWTWDVASDAVTWSNELLGIFGLPPQAGPFSYEMFLSMIHPDDRALVDGTVREAFERRASFAFDHRIVRPDGSVRALHGRGNVEIDDAGAVVRMVGSSQDITQRKHAEEELRERERRHRLLFERNPLPMWLYDVETLGIVQVNDAAIAHYGYGRDEFLDRTIADLLHPEESPTLLATRAAPGSGRREVPTHRHRRKDGTTILVETVSDDAWTQGRPARLVLAIDVSQRERLETRLRQAQKMEAVGQLAGGVAHDFNNIITVVNNYSTMLLEETPEDAPAAADLREIVNAADRAAGLTRQLLAFSRKQLLQPRTLSLDTVVAGLTPMLRRLIGEDIEVTTLVGSELGLVSADPGQVEQVIVNLAVNARDAMPDGGTLSIEIANAELGECQAPYSNDMVRPGPYVMLAVSDSGHGMDRATQARIFEPFFTTKDVGKGSGLGLATVYGIVSQSGGHLWVYSEPGQGTIFKIFFPFVDDASMHAASACQKPTAAPRGSETILLVEDEEAVRRLASRVLRRHGYTVLEARHGADALEIGRDHRLDLVLTDVVMPQMNGRELAAELSTLAPEVRIVYMSGYTDDEVIRRGLVDHGMAFLQKPFSGDRLASIVREVLDATPGRYPMGGHAAPMPRKATPELATSGSA